jgi:putative ABC transport system substrate-binding protein
MVDVKRREFIAMLGGTAASWPRATRAQGTGTPVIGFLSSAAQDRYRVYLDAFRRGLREVGFVEGQDVRIEYRWAEGQYGRLPALAADLVAREVTIIFATGGNPPAQAAKAATNTIPIVFVSGGDPVSGGLVASLNRPGGNVTGVSWIATALVPKRLDFLRQLIGNSAAISALVNPSFEDHALQQRELQEAGAAIGHNIRIVSAATAQQLDTVIASLVKQGAGGLIIGNDPYFLGRRDQIVALAAQYAIPTIYFAREFTDAGGLLSYGASLTQANRQGGIYTGKILKGAKPAELPVEQPTRFELVINLKTARALGITIPQSLLAQAEEVIE